MSCLLRLFAWGLQGVGVSEIGLVQRGRKIDGEGGETNSNE